jgi:uncharacterized protein (TIGR00255 family)
MTGFAKIEKEFPEGKISSEARSLNSRYLEMNIRLPRADYGSEQKLRELIKRHIKRGKVDITIKWEKTVDEMTIPRVNESIVRQYAAMVKNLKEHYGVKGDLTIDNVFSLKDVFVYEENNSLSEEILTETSTNLFVLLNEERAREGEYIRDDLNGRVETIVVNLSEIEKGWPAVIKAHEEKLRGKIAEVTQSIAVDETRILQEIAIFMERLDISEEIVRLAGHLDNFRATLSSTEPIGRKLDFVIQEMVRETNTIGSKSNDLYINERVIRIKVEIEKMREQVQNVE